MVTVAPARATRNVATPAPYIADEVAAILRLHPRTVITLAKRGELPSIRVGKLFRFPRAKIDALAHGETTSLVGVDTGGVS